MLNINNNIIIKGLMVARAVSNGCHAVLIIIDFQCVTGCRVLKNGCHEGRSAACRDIASRGNAEWLSPN